jgi:hypothetical protein
VTFFSLSFADKEVQENGYTYTKRIDFDNYKLHGDIGETRRLTRTCIFRPSSSSSIEGTMLRPSLDYERLVLTITNTDNLTNSQSIKPARRPFSIRHDHLTLIKVVSISG